MEKTETSSRDYIEERHGRWGIDLPDMDIIRMAERGFAVGWR